MGIEQMAMAVLEAVNAAAAGFDDPVLLAAFVCLATAGIVGLCVPGLLMPIAFSAGMVLDGWIAIPAVVAGAVLGSHALFLTGRYGMGDALERRIGPRMARFGPHLERYGLAYVALLSVIGTPHFLVTLASAAGPVRQRGFAFATMLGFLPAISLSAGAGWAL